MSTALLSSSYAAPQNREFLNYERAVYLMNDGGRWEFKTYGEVLPFEEPDRYLSRRLADRFTSEMLDTYCNALGIKVFDESLSG